MATRTLEIDLRQGTGASSEPMYGIVTVQRVKAKSTGGFIVLPFETSLKLVDGKATITQAVTDGTGPMYDSAYLFRVQNGYCGQRYGFMAALPDGTTPITTGEMPKVNPLTGEGIYMDAQEWNELYGDLPDRVDALETGKATMRVDNTAGTRVFISDGTSEKTVTADTGSRGLTLSATDLTGTLRVRRTMYTVEIQGDITNTGATGDKVLWTLPPGFRTRGYARLGVAVTLNGTTTRLVSTDVNGTGFRILGMPTGTMYLSVTYLTRDSWPAELPGTADGTIPNL